MKYKGVNDVALLQSHEQTTLTMHAINIFLYLYRKLNDYFEEWVYYFRQCLSLLHNALTWGSAGFDYSDD